MISVLLDILFPRLCQICEQPGAYLCSGCRLCLPAPNLPADISDSVVAAVGYSEDVARYVHAVKFGLYHAMCRDMAEMMQAALIKSFWKYDVLVPVPLSSKRKRWRGFNQAEKLAKMIDAEATKLMLKRTRDTQAQATLNKQERLANTKGAFEALSEAKGQRIVLIDDVYTTGATTNACSDALRSAGAKSVKTLVWAYTAV